MNAPISMVLVDQEQLLLDLLIAVLRSGDLKVYGATDTDRGLQLVQMYSPVLVVVDARVANALGFVELARRENPMGKVLLLVDSDDLLAECVAAGLGAAIADKRQGFDALVTTMRQSVGPSVPLRSEEGKVHLLIVDDEESIRTLVAGFLTTRGYAVTVATDGKEAIDCIASDSSIALVLMDISMPGMGGLETLRLIVSRNPHPPVIMATGVSDRDVAHQALKIGAFDYILKPFDLNSVESSISACLDHVAFQKLPWWKRLH